MTNKPIILVVDDEPAILATLKSALADEGYTVETLQDGHKTVATIGKLVPDLVLLDIFMPSCNGLELLTKIKAEYPQQAVMMISGFGNISIAIEALRKGAIDFIEKPLSLDEILPKIALFDESRKENGNGASTKPDHQPDDELVGKSYAFLELLRQARIIAPLDLPVHITGQPGTGKTSIAKHLARHAGGNDAGLTTIDCGTTAVENHVDAVLQAFAGNTRTLLLHHVEALSPQAQQTLHAQMRTHKGTKRVIATSCTSLFKRTREGTFNPSLMLSLSSIPLEVPPLRKRPYDIPLLVDHFRQQANNECTKNVLFSTSCIRQLRNHPWPGNVAELEHTVAKIVSMTPGNHDVVTPAELFSYWGERNTQPVEEQQYLSFVSLDDATEHFQKSFLTYLLRKNHFDLEQVSGHLSMSTTQLRNKLLELNIERP